MEEAMAELIISSLENILQSTSVPMFAATVIDRSDIKKAVGSLVAIIITEIDYKIIPLILREYPDIKSRYKPRS